MNKIGPGYGDLTNLIKVRKAFVIEHQEGVGTEESPMRTISTVFDENMKYIARIDPFNSPLPKP